MSRVEHINYNKKRLVICAYCQGSGQQSISSEYSNEDVVITACPKCKGEGVILSAITIVTRPITSEDKVYFRKIING